MTGTVETHLGNLNKKQDVTQMNVTNKHALKV